MNNVEFPCGCPLFPCVYVCVCMCSFVVTLILIGPFVLGGLPSLTYVWASLSPASPSVRGLHPKSFQMASFPLFPNSNCLSAPRSVSFLIFPRYWTQQSEKWKAREKEAMTGCWIRAHMCQHTVSITFCFDLTPLTSNTDPSCLTSTGLSTQWSDPRSNQSDSVRPRYTISNCFFLFQKKSSAGLQAVFADAF